MNARNGRPVSHGAFETLSVRELPEYQSTGIHLRHRATGCEVYHLRNEDAENLFSFNFRTPPRDSTGEAHIIEHSVLSGSRRFPLKDPFVVLLKSSMNTFLNAMTFPDKTIYPGSSMLEKDFFNLMLVYGDAVFFPLLREEIFRQEGHHVEFRDLTDPASGLKRTGVVYNEMKGALSSPESLAGAWSFRSLLPDTPYGMESGGDPRDMPRLTYEQFRDFHRRYYHPANCTIFLYGNIPTERHLEFLEDHFLGSFSRLEVNSVIPEQPRWASPRYVEKTFPVEPGESTEQQSTVTVNWLTVSALEPLELLTMEVLGEVLLGNAGSPLRRALVESNLGEDLAPTSGLDTELRQAVFSVGLRGTDPQRAAAVEDLVLETLREICRNGIERERLDAAVHQVEFYNREIRRGGRPYALRLLRRSLRGWLHGEPPEKTLEFRRWMDEFKRRALDDGGYLIDFLSRNLVDNPHRSTLLVRPDPGQGEREEREERSALEALEKEMSESDRLQTVRQGIALKEFQEAPPSAEDLRRIPGLGIGDLPREVQKIPCEESRLDGEIPVFYHDLFTNGIIYLDLAFPLAGLDPRHNLRLPLFAQAATASGLPGISYAEVAGQLALAAGAFSAGLDTGTPLGERRAGAWLIFRLKALQANLGRALELAGRLLLEADFGDHERLKNLILELRNDFKASVLPAGNQYAALRAGRRFSASLEAAESWQGVTQFLHIHEIARRLPESLAAEEAVLRDLRGRLITRGGLLVNLTVERADREAALNELRRLVERLPGSQAGPAPAADTPAAAGSRAGRPAEAGAGVRDEALVATTPVGYVARALRGARFDQPESAWEGVLAHFLATGYLWEKVRMRGGAYGASASPNGLEEVFTLSSYRDPNILSTLAAFREALAHAAEADISQEQIEQAVIGTVGREERPNAPGEKGFISFKRSLYGITDEIRQQRREHMLATDRARLSRVAGRLLEEFDRGYSVVLSNRSAVQEAAAELPDLLDNISELPV